MIKSPIVGNKFSEKQLLAIELLATGDYSHQDAATKVGVCPETISNWKKNYQFIDAIIQSSRELLKSELPTLYNRGMAFAKEGSVGHFNTILDHITKLEASKANTGQTISFSWEVEDEDNNPLQTP